MGWFDECICVCLQPSLVQCSHPQMSAGATGALQEGDGKSARRQKGGCDPFFIFLSRAANFYKDTYIPHICDIFQL